MKGEDSFQRGAFIVLPLVVIGLAAWVTSETAGPRIKRDVVVDSGAPVDAGAADAGGPVLALPTEPELDAGLSLTLSFDAAALMNGPKKIKVGIVFVTFAGADGAPANARSKPAALTLAKKLADEAKTDFAAAVKGGDSGSTADFGHLERGVLASEPGAEAAVFGLEPGAVSDVVETTRGYWIVKRID